MKPARELLPVELLLTEDERRTEPDELDEQRQAARADEIADLLEELRNAEPLGIDIKPERLRRR